MQSKDILVLNAIIFDIYNIKDEHAMREAFVGRIGKIIPCCRVAFFANRSADVALEDPVSQNIELEELHNYIKKFFYLDETAVFMYTAQSLVFRESQMLDEKKRMQSEYYKEVYEKNNTHYSLHINISFKGYFLGVVSLFRRAGEADFTDEEIMIAECLKSHLEVVLYQCYHGKDMIQHNGEEVLTFARRYQLTTRETDVLERIQNGLKNNQICEELIISPNTLKKYISSIYRKTNVTNRISLINQMQRFIEVNQ